MVRTLHRSLPIILAIAILVALPCHSSAAGWKLFKTIDGKHVSLKIKGKTRSYWMMDKDSPVSLKITGPCRFKVYTRMSLENNADEGVYSFVPYVDGERQPLIARAAQFDKTVEKAKRKTERLSRSRTIYFDVPSGSHEYRFTVPEGSRDVIYTRFLTPNHDLAPVSYIAYLPRSFPEEVRIVVKENEYIYYRCNRENSIQLEVIGPTRVKCISRLEFDYSIRGKKPYRVQVNENGNVALTDYFTSEISGTASYVKPSKMVLGMGDAFFINVPSGKHSYSITTPDLDISVIFRFYIPEKDLGNECNEKSSTHAFLHR